jgi:hypothetical protein
MCCAAKCRTSACAIVNRIVVDDNAVGDIAVGDIAFGFLVLLGPGAAMFRWAAARLDGGL